MATTAVARTQEDKQVRGQYRELLTRVKNERHSLSSRDGEQLVELVLEANQLHENVHRPREQAVDSEFLALVAGSGAEYARGLASVQRSVGPGDLLARLRARFGAAESGGLAWRALGLAGRGVLSPAPAPSTMLGALSALVRRRESRVRQRAGPAAPEERPRVLAEEEAEGLGERETDRRMGALWEALRRCPREEAELVPLVLSHASFAQTVENLFALSFLVRDGRVALEKDAERGVLVKAAADAARRGAGTTGRGHPSSSQPAPAPQAERVQNVLAYSPRDWRLWCRVVDPSETLAALPATEPANPEHSLGPPSAGPAPLAVPETSPAAQPSVSAAGARLRRGARGAKRRQGAGAEDVETEEAEDGEPQRRKAGRGRPSRKIGRLPAVVKLEPAEALVPDVVCLSSSPSSEGSVVDLTTG